MVELDVADDVEHIESIRKTEGFNLSNSKKCKKYIIQHTIGNENDLRSMFGIKILENLKQQEEKLKGAYVLHIISSDIIESIFGVFKRKESPYKLYGILPFILFIPLHAKQENDSVTRILNFKERLCNIKLMDIDVFEKKHMVINLGYSSHPRA